MSPEIKEFKFGETFCGAKETLEKLIGFFERLKDTSEIKPARLEFQYPSTSLHLYLEENTLYEAVKDAYGRGEKIFVIIDNRISETEINKFIAKYNDLCYKIGPVDIIDEFPTRWS